MVDAVVVALVLLAVGAAPAADPTWYVRRDTWQESMITSREAIMRQESDAASSGAATPRWGPWYCLGPIKVSAANADFESLLVSDTPPETGDAAAIQPDDPTRRWVMHPQYTDACIHKLYPDEHVAYLRRSITTTSASAQTLYLDVTGEMTVWLNGEQLLGRSAGHISYDLWGGDPLVNPTAIPLTLRAGRNRLLVKVELHPQPRPADDTDPWRKATREARRPWGTVFNGHTTVSGPAADYEKLAYREVSNFYASTSATLGPVADAGQLRRERLWQLLERDFTDETSRGEMRCERREGLWAWDWEPGNIGELASRFAEAVRDGELLAAGRRQAARAGDIRSLQSVRDMYHHARAIEAGKRCLTDDDCRKTLAHQIASLRLAITDLIETYQDAYPGGAEFLARLSAVEELARRAMTEQQYECFARVGVELRALRRQALLANPLLDSQRLLIVKRRANPHFPDLPFNWANHSSLSTHGFDNEIAVLSPADVTVHSPAGRDAAIQRVSPPPAPPHNIADLHGPVTAKSFAATLLGGGHLPARERLPTDPRPAGAANPAEGKQPEDMPKTPALFFHASTLFRPAAAEFVGDIDLHFEGDRLLFSMPDSRNRWQLFEIRTDGSGLRQVTRGDQPDVDSFDGCYLPNGRIMFCSTAVFAGVPCVKGRDHVGVLFVMDSDGGNVRQVCFEQDQDFCPVVLNDGRVLYTRWEYADIPHFFSRLLFSMNPDGTDQKAFYGSNSYWPNGVFYSRPIPGRPSQVAGIVSGHHVARRSGELVLLDSARGDHEAGGVIQRIPGRGQKVEPIINDRLVAGSWPKFLHPFPLSDKYFLVSCKPDETSRWAIYLVDVFDNMVPLYEDEQHDLLEPIPLRATAKPPVIPDRVDLARQEAIVNLTNIYSGPGLAGVPPGTVKQLRVIAYHYAFQDMADDSQAIGVDASWDTVKLVLGTVPVYEDGSAMFRVPANTPLTVQPLDARGRALQLMRSWMTAMPGETLSCVGCHASAPAAPAVRSTLAAQNEPDLIEPWYGPPRGFSFQREVQPVLDRFCVGCHNGSSSGNNSASPDLTDHESAHPRGFSPAYMELHRFVRRPGAETDYHLLPAAEYHAGTSELIQLLEKGHHNVELDAEAWDRLNTWIDLNVPFHGTWHEAQGADRVGDQDCRRRELRKLYTGLDDDPEVVVPIKRDAPQPLVPEPLARPPIGELDAPGWPFSAAEAQRRQQADGVETTRTIDLGAGVVMQLVRIPAGDFIMGDAAGHVEERPRREQVSQPCWIGRFEVTNEQFARFDPTHDSRYMRTHGITFTRGYPVNLPRQPVVRVSWNEARDFCQWLTDRTGEPFSLPTEAMWEYACRAGTATPLSYGDLDTDFSGDANLGDLQLEHLRDYSHNSPLAWMPRDARFDDGAMVTAPVGSYRPNAWDLCDMHGNVAEWTQSIFSPRSAASQDGTADSMVVRGGSWRDRPARSRSSFRIGYPAWQTVHNVGFRVVCQERTPGL